MYNALTFLPTEFCHLPVEVFRRDFPARGNQLDDLFRVDPDKRYCAPELQYKYAMSRGTHVEKTRDKRGRGQAADFVRDGRSGSEGARGAEGAGKRRKEGP